MEEQLVQIMESNLLIDQAKSAMNYLFVSCVTIKNRNLAIQLTVATEYIVKVKHL